MKKRALTLLEIMVVVILITMITAVIGYNFKGSLEKGKEFKTKQGISQLNDIFALYLAENSVTVDDIIKKPAEHLKKTHMAKDPKNLIKDGWGDQYIFTKNADGELEITSKNIAKVK
jgi:general secretion pathway protein G